MTPARPQRSSPATSRCGLTGTSSGEVVAGTAMSHRTRGTPRTWSLLDISADTLTVTEHFARQAGWRTAEPASFPMGQGSHRP